MFQLIRFRNRFHVCTAILFSIPVLALLSTCSGGTWESGELEVVEGFQSAAAYYMPSRSPAATEPAEELIREPDYRGTPYYGTRRSATGRITHCFLGLKVQEWLQRLSKPDIPDVRSNPCKGRLLLQ